MAIVKKNSGSNIKKTPLKKENESIKNEIGLDTVALNDNEIIDYYFQGSKKSINRTAFETLSSADRWYNAVLNGSGSGEYSETWNVPTGTYYGVLAESFYTNQGHFNESIIIRVIIDEELVLCSKLKSSGAFSPWRIAFSQYWGENAPNQYEYSMEGIILRFDVVTKIYGDDKEVSTINRIQFISNEEYNTIMECGGYYEEGDEDA